MGRILLVDDEGEEEREHPSAKAISPREPQHARDVDGQTGVESTTSPVEPSSDAQSNGGIRLDHFLQRCGAAMTGGHAKLLIQSGEVTVDDEVETRRRRKLRAGQVVGCGGGEYAV